MAFDVLDKETNHRAFLDSFIALQPADTYCSDYLDAVAIKFEQMNAGAVVGSYIPKVQESLAELIVSNSWVCEDMRRSPPTFKHTWASDVVILVKKYAIASGMALSPFPGAAALFTADGPAVAFIWDMRTLCKRGVSIRDHWKYLVHNMTPEAALSHLEIICLKTKQSVFIPPTHSIALVVDGSLEWNKVIVSPIICESLYVKEDIEFWVSCHMHISEEIAKMGSTKRGLQCSQVQFSKWIGDIVNRLQSISKKGHSPSKPPTVPVMGAIADGAELEATEPPKKKPRMTAAAAARLLPATVATEDLVGADGADVTEQVTDEEAEL